MCPPAVLYQVVKRVFAFEEKTRGVCEISRRLKKEMVETSS